MGEERNLGGQPKRFTPDQIKEKGEDYFKWCNEQTPPQRYTYTGLAYHIGFTSRQQMYDYQEYEGYSDIIKRFKLLIESGYERNLHSAHTSGSIFALKRMSGKIGNWDDKDEEEKSNAVNTPELIKEIVNLIQVTGVNADAIKKG